MSMSEINYSELMQHMPNIILVIGWGVMFCFVTYLFNDTDEDEPNPKNN